MLRNRSRAVTSSNKQALMADHTTQISPAAKNYSTPIPSFFDSPRFKAFTSTEAIDIKSPTSILDNKPFFSFGNPFAFDIKNPKSPKFFSPENMEPKGIALVIVDTSISNNQIEDKCSSEASYNKKVLRVQIPPLPVPASLLSPTSTSPKSPTDFGIKSKNSHLLLSPPFGSPPQVFTGCLPVKEMELSEDYTCVISHGPNPKTTHIFDNCVVGSYCNVWDHNKKPKPAAQESFLSFCHRCKKNLEQKIDIYIYRGDKAFCSQECRYQEMLLDGEEN